MSEHLAHEGHLQQCLRALQTRGWEQRLQPLATRMVEKHLVRARGHAGAPLQHLDLEVLREALSRLLREDWEDAALIVDLVVDGTEPAQVAAERGVSHAVLVEQLGDSVDALAIAYEDTANACLGQSPQEQVRTALARKRG